ncbi:hypothetical protein B0H94_11440 [Salsuginibacillus halophilus]|uniref:ArsR family transcriptional regulator n=1 Tax=Salsuginibacillus halophilus TaxID=517424 RepID=A0A2P8H8K7_9BACI|nr:ArsR family transcriptional regulator [Salsuginibacillus halophilus]PSL42566.1 hypothetical protein B0H94_11440 [Salsuginibacillus halophilus]
MHKYKRLTAVGVFGAVLLLAACNDDSDMPMDSEDMPMDEEDMPMDEDGMPMDEEDMPMDEDGMPMDEEDMPMDEEDMPMDEDGMPMDEEDMGHGEHGASAEEREAFEEEAAQLPENLNEGAGEGLTTTNTKNITRLDDEDPQAFSIMASQTIWPATHEANQPGTIILAEQDEWQHAVAALTLVHHPNDGPLLFMEDGLSDDLTAEIERLAPLGNDDDIEILVAGELSDEDRNELNDYTVEEITEEEPAAFAKDVEDMFAETTGNLPDNVVIASSEDAYKSYAMPAGSWISHMDESLLYVDDTVPEATAEALEARDGEANMYVMNGEGGITDEVLSELEDYGTVEEIAGDDPVEHSINFAKYQDENFGWGIDEPGHGLVFGSTAAPELAMAGAPLAHLGKHAPLIWMEDELEQAHADYLAELKPAFVDVPMEGPYNHGYILGTENVISFEDQGAIDDLMEIDVIEGDAHADH